MMSGADHGNNLHTDKENSAWQEKVDSLIEITAKSLLSLLSAESCYYLSRPGTKKHRKFILMKGKIKGFELKSGELLLSNLEDKLKSENSFLIQTPDEEIPAVAFRVFSSFPRDEINRDLSISFSDRQNVFATFIVLKPGRKIQLNSRKRMELEAYLASSFQELILQEKSRNWANVVSRLKNITSISRQELFCKVAGCLEELKTPILYSTGLMYVESKTRDLEGTNFTNGYLLYQKGHLFSEKEGAGCKQIVSSPGFLSVSNPEESQLVKLVAGWQYLYNNSPETTFHYSIIPKKLFSFNNLYLDTLPGSYVITYPLLRKFDSLTTAKNTFKGVGIIILPDENFDLTCFRGEYLSSLGFAMGEALTRSVEYASEHMIPAIIENNFSLLHSSQEAFCNSVLASLKNNGMNLAYFDLRLADLSGEYYNFPKFRFGAHSIPPGFINEFLYEFTASEKPYGQMYYEGNISLMAIRINSENRRGLLFIVNGKTDEDHKPQPFDDYDQEIFRDLGQELMEILPE